MNILDCVAKSDRIVRRRQIRGREPVQDRA